MSNPSNTTIQGSETEIIIKQLLPDYIIEQICADLYARNLENNNLDHNTVSSHVWKVATFVYENHDNINAMVEKMIVDYKKDNDLFKLISPNKDAITEYLYYFVKCHPNYDEFDINDLN